MYEHPTCAEIELFFQCYFVLWLELQEVLKAAERQIEVLGDVRSTQEKEIIIIDQAFVV